jgi:alpha-methylacyl-CoA racemase
MVLADLGADVIRVERSDGVDTQRHPGQDVWGRGRRSVAVDLKHQDGAEVVLRLVECADGLIEGFRPGVVERLGVGPDNCLARNPRLVFARMTGWGQDGAYADVPGHDINYIALSGALAAIGRPGAPPTIPLNLVGDFGGGGMLLAVGLLAGIIEAKRSGQGQTIDVAMCDGAALLMTLFHGMQAAGQWTDERGGNLIDGGAPFYDVYETADGGHMSIGCLEPQFYAALLDRLGYDDLDPREQMETMRWPALRERFAATFRTRTRAEWEAAFAGTEICAAPVLTMREASAHPHSIQREAYIDVGGVLQPAPAPRFARTPAPPVTPPAQCGADTLAALRDWGFNDGELDALAAEGVVRQRNLEKSRSGL